MRAGSLALALALGCAPVAWSQDGASEAAYLAENHAAMEKMMHDMMVEPTGDVDRDFVAMMAPHHQGAVDMARAYLRAGRNEQLRRLAQEIIVTQQQEITVMRRALGDPASGGKNETDRSQDHPSLQHHPRQ